MESIGFTSIKEYYLSHIWESYRNKRIREDNYKCTECGAKRNLQVHHKTYKNLGNEKIDDLITLCKKCHKKIHKEK